MPIAELAGKHFGGVTFSDYYALRAGWAEVDIYEKQRLPCVYVSWLGDV